MILNDEEVKEFNENVEHENMNSLNNVIPESKNENKSISSYDRSISRN